MNQPLLHIRTSVHPCRNYANVSFSQIGAFTAAWQENSGFGFFFFFFFFFFFSLVAHVLLPLATNTLCQKGLLIASATLESFVHLISENCILKNPFWKREVNILNKSLWSRWEEVGWECYSKHTFVCLFFALASSQRAHDFNTTSAQRRCNVMTLHRRWGDVVLTSCACWVLSSSIFRWTGKTGVSS